MVFGFIALIIYGILRYYMSIGKENYNNPYLTFGTYKPICDIVISLMWAVVLYSKSVKVYCSKNGI